MADDPVRPGRVAGEGDEGDGAGRLVRAAVIRAYDRGDTLTLLGGDGVARRLSGDSAALGRVVLGYVAEPRTRGEIVAYVARLAGVAVAEVPASLDDLLTLLGAAGAVVAAGAGTGTGTGAGTGAGTGTRAGSGKRVVLGVTGAVAACDAPQLARALLGRGYAVRAVLTRAARRFVTADALRAVTHEAVYSDLSESEEAAGLAAWADVVLIAPASARTVARLASGNVGDLVAAVALGTRAPVVVAPSMNDGMLAAPAVQRNLERLREDGLVLVHPAFGVEVALAPTARRPMLGPAPPASVLADVVDHVLGAARVGGEAGPADWERAWAACAPETHPWHTEELDADLAAAMDRAAAEGPGRRLLDLGAGAGTAAVAAARRGFQVVALDVAPSALAAARQRAGTLPITWVLDDATRPRLWGQFNVLLDRGLLHTLPQARRADYAAALARLAAPGAVLLVKTHVPEDGPLHRTAPPTPAELEALLGAHFALVDTAASTFPGPAGAPRAVLYTLRRR